MLLFRDSFTLSRICCSTRWRICSPNTRSLVFKLSRYSGTCVKEMGIISKAGIVQEEGHKSNQRYSTLFKCLITKDFSSGGRPEKVPNPLDQYLLCAWPTGRETIFLHLSSKEEFPFVYHIWCWFVIFVFFIGFFARWIKGLQAMLVTRKRTTLGLSTGEIKTWKMSKEFTGLQFWRPNHYVENAYFVSFANLWQKCYY